MRVLIVGAGGHGEVVADALGSARRIDAGAPEVIGFLDDDPERWGTVCADLPVLGAVAAARSVPPMRWSWPLGTTACAVG
jgi:FlaA1/EpsC-like NDP-sugar epimerase